MAIDVRFDERDWARLRRDWTAWWEHSLERPLIVFTRLDPPAGVELPPAPGFVPQLPLEEMSDEQVVDRYQAQVEATRCYADAWPKWWINYGPGIMAGFLGGRVRTAQETVWFEPPDGRPADPAGLHFQYDPDNVWWRRVRRQTEIAAGRWGKRACVSHTDIGGNADVLASFLTTEGLLLAMVDCPDEIDRLTAEITRLWLRYYDELAEVILPAGAGTSPWAPIWSPKRCYMFQSDYCFMIGPAMFERFVLPDLKACCDHMEHGFYHLDGPGQIRHLDMLLGIDSLRGIQWVPGAGRPEASEWLDLLKRIRDGGKLCQVFASAEGTLKILRELGGEGFVIYVGDSRLNSDKAVKEFLADVERLTG